MFSREQKLKNKKLLCVCVHVFYTFGTVYTVCHGMQMPSNALTSPEQAS